MKAGCEGKIVSGRGDYRHTSTQSTSLNDFRGKMKLELIVCFGKHYFQVDFDFFP
jgi:hypothetical protein